MGLLDLVERVFLDTNVVLTGAFNPKGPAGSLNSLCNEIQFLHSPLVLEECAHLTARGSPTPRIHLSASNRIREYLKALKSHCVPDCSPPPGLRANDPGDDLILGAALAAQASVMCTYNINDFPTGILSIQTPLSLQRAVGEPVIEQYIQPVVLTADAGTLLFYGRVHHPSSMGCILKSGETSVFADEQGFIQCRGPSVIRHTAEKPLKDNEEFRMTIRYNTSDLKVEVWTKSNGEWASSCLSSGAVQFSEAPTPILCFVPDHQFCGHIQSISGLHRYVRNRALAAALDNYSLEAVAGSLDLKSYLTNTARR